MHIPLPDMLRSLRETLVERKLGAPFARWALKLWAGAAVRPKCYKQLAGLGSVILRRSSNLPAPEGKTFQQLRKEKNHG